jgi:hypothetical protein
MEPPETLVIHAVPHPNPKARQVGFALDDPYVEQVWAGVIGPSALLARRRLPVLWREREPALVDLRELGQSLGLGPSLARSGRTWRTIERLVGFRMAHWLPGDELGVRTQVAPLNPVSSHGCTGEPARSTTGCSACTSTGSPSPTPTRPSTPTSSSTPPASPPASTTSSTAAPPSPAASASNHDPSPGPPTPPGPGPPRVPHRRPPPTDPARTPLQVPLRGTCRPSPERDAVRFTITPTGRRRPGVAQIVDADVSSLALRSLPSTLRRNRSYGRDPDRRSRPRKGDTRCVCRTEAAATSRTSDRATDDAGGPSSDDRQL